MSQEPKVLLVTDSLALPASIVLWVLQQFQHKLVKGSSLALVTQASNGGGNLMLKACSLDAVISLAETTGFHTIEWLSEIAKALRPGGCLIVQEHMGSRPSASHNNDPDIQVAATEAEADLERKILLAGFIGLTKSEILKEVESPEAFQITESKSCIVPQPITINAQKPAWEMGAVFEIKKPVISIRDEEAVIANAPSIVLYSDDETTAKKLDFAAKDGAAILALETSEIDTESDFIDEDALLAEEDLDSPVLPTGGDDCEVGNNSGRKACKNCTCGRAELEEKGKLTPEQLNNPKSACGNCGLGDAFRCNSCPYRGLPPFKLGEKIILSGSLQTVDA